jgi:hypothetical protein
MALPDISQEIGGAVHSQTGKSLIRGLIVSMAEKIVAE